MTALLRSRTGGLHAGLCFPNAATAGCQIPSGSLYRLHYGSTAAAANTALGVSYNAGWSYASGTWTIPSDSVFYGVYFPSGLPLSSTTSATVESCLIQNSYTGAPPWTPLTAFVVNDTVQATPVTGAYFKCTTAGTSGATQPSWPSSGTVSDGGTGLVWTYELKYAAWAATTAYAVNDIVQPTVINGALYKVYTAGTSGSTEPTWPDVGMVSDGSGGLVWEYYPQTNYGAYIAHTSGTTIQNCTVSGYDNGINRVNYAMDSIYGDDTDLLIQNCNIYWMRVGINCCPTITILNNYIHDNGYAFGDHTEGIYVNGASSVLISGNTILNPLSETAALYIYNATTQTGCTVTGNLLAGGSYPLYPGDPSSTYMVIEGNYFSTAYYAGGGSTGFPVYSASTPNFSTGTGNQWAGNYWYDGTSAGSLITAP